MHSSTGTQSHDRIPHCSNTINIFLQLYIDVEELKNIFQIFLLCFFTGFKIEKFHLLAY